MPRTCSICTHVERNMIDQELFRNTVPLRNIAEQFKVAATSLHRHKKHVPAEVQKALRGEKLTADLSPRKQRYVEGRLAGKNKRQAALDAGFSESMASHASTKVETRDVRAVLARVVREAVPPEQIAKTLAEGMAATEIRFVSNEGEVTEREVPDFSERRQAAALAAELGYGARDNKQERGGGVILLFADPPKPEPENRTIEATPENKSPILLLEDAPKQEPEEESNG